MRRPSVRWRRRRARLRPVPGSAPSWRRRPRRTPTWRNCSRSCCPWRRRGTWAWASTGSVQGNRNEPTSWRGSAASCRARGRLSVEEAGRGLDSPPSFSSSASWRTRLLLRWCLLLCVSEHWSPEEQNDETDNETLFIAGPRATRGPELDLVCGPKILLSL